ncbi:hypothetical protein ACFL4A_01295 [bacterium]
MNKIKLSIIISILSVIILTGCGLKYTAKYDIVKNHSEILQPNKNINLIWTSQTFNFSNFKTMVIPKFINSKFIETKIDRNLIDPPHIYLKKMLNRSRIPIKFSNNNKSPKALNAKALSKYEKDLAFGAIITDIREINKETQREKKIQISVQFMIYDLIHSHSLLLASHTQKGLNATDCLERICSDIATFLTNHHFTE